MSEPLVVSYLSCVDFLRDYYLFRKSKNSGFSYEVWAREISYPHRSNLRLILKGERGIPAQLERQLVDKIFKSGRERQYFKLLCEIHKTKNLEKRSALQKKAMKLQSQQERTVGQEPGHYEILDSLYLMVLLGFEDIDRSAKGLSKLLKQNTEDVQGALEKLQARGLVHAQAGKKGQTQWMADGQYTIFKDDYGNQLLAGFHRQSFLKAIAAQRLPKDKRRFDSLVLPLSPKDYAEMVRELEGFLDMLFYKYNATEFKGKSLYHLQIGTFPVV